LLAVILKLAAAPGTVLPVTHPVDYAEAVNPIIEFDGLMVRAKEEQSLKS